MFLVSSSPINCPLILAKFKLEAMDEQQGHLGRLAQREVKELLQSALDAAISVVHANLDVLEGLGSLLEGKLSKHLVPSSLLSINVLSSTRL